MPLSSQEINKHIATINDELSAVKEDMARIKTDITWLKKFQWLILTTAISSLLVGLVRVLLNI